jgi:pyruvate dehydrogenase E2 component (dihydrolipoamide acetyltransferase)
MGAIKEVLVPDIGDFKTVDVIEVLVKPGDNVIAEQSLITVESDKATMEIPSPGAGVVKEIRVKVGDKVSEGTAIIVIEAADTAPSVTAKAPSPAPVPARTSAPLAMSPPPAQARPPVASVAADALPPSKAHASPSVRKFARELGLEIGAVTGSGPKGRILQSDVQAHVKAVIATGGAPSSRSGASGVGFNVLPWPQVDFAKYGPIEIQPLSRIKKIAGANLARNWVMIPHVTNNDEADITDLEAFRVQLNKENEKAGVKLTLLAFLIKACAVALKRLPEFNASLDGDSLVLKRYYHIGFAADTPNGLVVPVVKDADRKGILDIAKETTTLAAAAREGKLKPADMQGGTFSISSLGGIGGTHFSPIINAPEVAILGVSKAAMKPVWDGKQFVPRLIVPLSLSFDHRVVDGAAAARFNATLGQLLADMRRTLL